MGSEKQNLNLGCLWVIIWLKRVAMISYVMLDIRSISFQKYKNKIKFLSDMQFPSRAIWVTSLRSLSTYATCFLIELCQIVVTLWENHFIRPWSRSRTHPPTCYTSNTWKIASTSIHPQIKLHVVSCLSFSKVIYMMYGLYKKK